MRRRAASTKEHAQKERPCGTIIAKLDEALQARKPWDRRGFGAGNVIRELAAVMPQVT
jgi:hypothetical protein